jgi:PEP-CTERM motif
VTRIKKSKIVGLFGLLSCATFNLVGTAQAAVVINFAPNPINTNVVIDPLTGPGSFAFNFNGYSGNGAPSIAGLSSSIAFNFLGTSGNRYNFSYALNNTSAAPINAARLTIFAFNANPNSVSVSVGAGNQFNVVASGPQPNGLQPAEICFKDAGPAGNCAGANQGLAIGGTSNGTFSLNFASLPTALTLDGFTVRYQGIASGALGISGGSASGLVITPVVSVPEPASWGLLIAGFGLVGGQIRRKRAAVALA